MCVCARARAREYACEYVCERAYVERCEMAHDIYLNHATAIGHQPVRACVCVCNMWVRACLPIADRLRRLNERELIGR